MPDDEHWQKPLSIDDTTQKDRKYKSVLFKERGSNTNIKSYEVNEHLVYAGCEIDELSGKKYCKDKQLYLVLHPIEEWNSFHVRKLPFYND